MNINKYIENIADNYLFRNKTKYLRKISQEEFVKQMGGVYNEMKLGKLIEKK